MTAQPRQPATVALPLRALLLGVAAGCRSSLGVAAPALTWRTPGNPARWATSRRLGAAAAVAGELVTDKLPATPPRTWPPAFAGRVASGAGGAAWLAVREGGSPVLSAAAGAVGAVAGTRAGAWWRAHSAGRRADWHGAVAEDAVALLLAAAAVLTAPRPRVRLTVVRD